MLYVFIHIKITTLLCVIKLLIFRGKPDLYKNDKRKYNRQMHESACLSNRKLRSSGVNAGIRLATLSGSW